MGNLLGGYAGEILWIDLTNRQYRKEKVTEDMARTWLGGSGFAAAVVSEMVPPHADPLGPENILGFFTGPLTGTPVPSSGRHSVAGKSPLTGIWGEASVGGNWGRALKYAGYDAVVLTGQSSEPVYIWIHEDKVEIRSAENLWGMDTYEIEEAIRKLTHPKAQVSSIGSAGERLSKIAGIFTDGHEGRTAARCGLGAIAGSKKVKAIAVYGQKTLHFADKAALLKKIKEVTPTIRERAKGTSDLGTAGLVIPCEKIGDFPVKNWTLGSWEEGAMKISGVALKEKYLTGRFHCFACPIGCGRQIAITKGKYSGLHGAGPEYETLGLFGGSCLIDDLEAICYANELCNRYGVDTIEVGNLIAFSMEAYEKGIITKEDTDGREIKWGDTEIFIELVKEIGEVKGFGAILSQGFPDLIKKYGHAVKEISIVAKGLSFPAHEPRAYNSLALGYATANRGACHCEAFSHPFERSLTMPELGIEKSMDRFAKEGKGELVAKSQNYMMLFDSAALCKFTMLGGAVTPTILAEWISLATGIYWSWEELLKCGERIFNKKRLFNIQCGVDRKEDTLPERILKEPRGSGGAADNLPPLEAMLDDYYAFRGWDSNGIPTIKKLQDLGLA
ncbi:aldehyde ferredoxin oxidoreductase family protein [Petroclostridium sp. X23]|uniref:aldehyde ferredoxin oxidoreductase family protein n=1 Tax=Petroclostridium sp. X23 TaxID=3045146 RepID=UPI0024ACF937|nr:aldehyde ferredoxin oxidoreductase family protein [Petroclostridium sp. X23]WHH59281.1 aldehyde ferredoxin oxidoreductase family protein [Petroclostridium sp. X23]